jgi:hypothetical protein
VSSHCKLPKATSRSVGSALICGDSRDSLTVAQLFDGRKANLVVTSPPYATQREYDPASGFQRRNRILEQIRQQFETEYWPKITQILSSYEPPRRTVAAKIMRKWFALYQAGKTHRQIQIEDPDAKESELFGRLRHRSQAARRSRHSCSWSTADCLFGAPATNKSYAC